MNKITYERDGIPKTFPTTRDIEVMQINGVAGIWCSPLCEEKFEKVVLLVDNLGEEGRKIVAERVQEIVNEPYDNLAAVLRMWQE